MLIFKKFYISSFHNSSVFHQITAITYGSVRWWFSVTSDSLLTHGLQPARLLCPWNSLGKNTGVGSHSLLQGIFPTQWSNLVSRIAGRFFTIWATKEANIIIQIIEGGMISQSHQSLWRVLPYWPESIYHMICDCHCFLSPSLDYQPKMYL